MQRDKIKPILFSIVKHSSAEELKRQLPKDLVSGVMVAVVAHASAGAAVVAGAGVSMHGFSVSFGLQAVLLGVSLAGTIAFVHGKRHGKAAKGAAAA